MTTYFTGVYYNNPASLVPVLPPPPPIQAGEYGLLYNGRIFQWDGAIWTEIVYPTYGVFSDVLTGKLHTVQTIIPPIHEQFQMSFDGWYYTNITNATFTVYPQVNQFLNGAIPVVVNANTPIILAEILGVYRVFFFFGGSFYEQPTEKFIFNDKTTGNQYLCNNTSIQEIPCDNFKNAIVQRYVECGAETPESLIASNVKLHIQQYNLPFGIVPLNPQPGPLNDRYKFQVYSTDGIPGGQIYFDPTYLGSPTWLIDTNGLSEDATATLVSCDPDGQVNVVYIFQDSSLQGNYNSLTFLYQVPIDDPLSPTLSTSVPEFGNDADITLLSISYPLPYIPLPVVKNAPNFDIDVSGLTSGQTGYFNFTTVIGLETYLITYLIKKYDPGIYNNVYSSVQTNIGSYQATRVISPDGLAVGKASYVGSYQTSLIFGDTNGTGQLYFLPQFGTLRTGDFTGSKWAMINQGYGSVGHGDSLALGANTIVSGLNNEATNFYSSVSGSNNITTYPSDRYTIQFTLVSNKLILFGLPITFNNIVDNDLLLITDRLGFYRYVVVSNSVYVAGNWEYDTSASVNFYQYPTANIAIGLYYISVLKNGDIVSGSNNIINSLGGNIVGGVNKNITAANSLVIGQNAEGTVINSVAVCDGTAGDNQIAIYGSTMMGNPNDAFLTHSSVNQTSSAPFNIYGLGCQISGTDNLTSSYPIMNIIAYNYISKQDVQITVAGDQTAYFAAFQGISNSLFSLFGAKLYTDASSVPIYSVILYVRNDISPAITFAAGNTTVQLRRYHDEVDLPTNVVLALCTITPYVSIGNQISGKENESYYGFNSVSGLSNSVIGTANQVSGLNNSILPNTTAITATYVSAVGLTFTLQFGSIPNEYSHATSAYLSFVGADYQGAIYEIISVNQSLSRITFNGTALNTLQPIYVYFIFSNNLVSGTNNTVYSSNSLISGQQNISYGNNVSVLGIGSITFPNYSTVEGFYNNAGGTAYQLSVNGLNQYYTASTLFLANTVGIVPGDIIYFPVDGSINCRAIITGVAVNSVNLIASPSGPLPVGSLVFPSPYSSASTRQYAIVIKNNSTNSQHVEGITSVAQNTSSHAEGSSFAIGEYSHAQGFGSQAIGRSSHTEGTVNISFGENSHTEGNRNIAVSPASHVEGIENIAHSGSDCSHVEGTSNQVSSVLCHIEGESNEIATSSAISHVEGGANYLQGDYSHVEGYFNSLIQITGMVCSHVEGFNNRDITAIFCHVEGTGHRNISGGACHVEGVNHGSVGISGGACHVEGQNHASVSGNYSHTEGEGQISVSGVACHAEGTSHTVSANYSHAEGSSNTIQSTAVNAHAEGSGNNIQAPNSHVEGTFNTITSTTANASIHVEGFTNTNITGLYCHVEGSNNQNVSGQSCHVEGESQGLISGRACHAEGTAHTVAANYAHAEGSTNVIQSTATNSHAEGSGNNIQAPNSHIEGSSNTITSIAADAAIHVEGKSNTVITGLYCHVEGNLNTNVSGQSCHVEGSNHGLTGITGTSCHVEGNGHASVSGQFSHAEGSGQLEVSGIACHAEGSSHTVRANFAHAEGNGHLIEVSAASSHAEGLSNIIRSTAPRSHVEGQGNEVLAANSHIEGNANTITSTNSNGCIHVEGFNNKNVSGLYCHVEGSNHGATSISGGSCHVEGNGHANITGLYCHVEGETQGVISGQGCHAEGRGHTVSANYAHAEGNGNSIATLALNSHAEGSSNIIQFLAANAHAEGTGNNTQGPSSHIEGNLNSISNDTAVSAHVEGTSNTFITGAACHVEGFNNGIINNGISGNYCHVEGNGHINITGQSCHVEGSTNGANLLPISGVGCHVEGQNNVNITGNYCHVEGVGHGTTSAPVSGIGCHVEGNGHRNITGNYCHVEGVGNGSAAFPILGIGCHVEGNNNVNILGNYAHIEGINNQLSNASSTGIHIEGDGNNLTGVSTTTHIEGFQNVVNALIYCHVEGNANNCNTCTATHIEGTSNSALNSDYCHLEGRGNATVSDYCHLEGRNGYAGGDLCHNEGLFCSSSAFPRTIAPAAITEYNLLAGTYWVVATSKLFFAPGTVLTQIAVNDIVHFPDLNSNRMAVGIVSQVVGADPSVVLATLTDSIGLPAANVSFSGTNQRAMVRRVGQTSATFINNHSEGMNSATAGPYAHSENSSMAIGLYSHSENVGTAVGNYSHAGGIGSLAVGTTSFVHGNSSYALADDSVIMGPSNSITPAGIVGNYIYGTGNSIGNVSLNTSVVGHNNVINNANIGSVFGSSNSITNATNTTVVGVSNVINTLASVSGCTIVGSVNSLTVNATACYMFGRGNSISGVSQFSGVFGSDNVLSATGNYSFVVGSNITSSGTGANNMVIGSSTATVAISANTNLVAGQGGTITISAASNKLLNTAGTITVSAANNDIISNNSNLAVNGSGNFIALQNGAVNTNSGSNNTLIGQQASFNVQSTQSFYVAQNSSIIAGAAASSFGNIAFASNASAMTVNGNNNLYFVQGTTATTSLADISTANNNFVMTKNVSISLTNAASRNNIIMVNNPSAISMTVNGGNHRIIGTNISGSTTTQNNTIIGSNLVLPTGTLSNCFITNDGNPVVPVQQNQFVARFAANQVNTQASYVFYTHQTNLTGAQLNYNASAWSAISSKEHKNKKSNIDFDCFIEKFAKLNLENWSYKWDDSRTYCTPYLEDIREIFGCSSDQKTIDTMELDSLLFAGLKSLYCCYKKYRQQNDAKITELEQTNQDLIKDYQKQDQEIVSLQAKLSAQDKVIDSLIERLSSLENITKHLDMNPFKK